MHHIRLLRRFASWMLVLNQNFCDNTNLMIPTCDRERDQGALYKSNQHHFNRVGPIGKWSNRVNCLHSIASFGSVCWLSVPKVQQYQISPNENKGQEGERRPVQQLNQQFWMMQRNCSEGYKCPKSSHLEKIVESILMPNLSKQTWRKIIHLITLWTPNVEQASPMDCTRCTCWWMKAIPIWKNRCSLARVWRLLLDAAEEGHIIYTSHDADRLWFVSILLSSLVLLTTDCSL